MTQQIFHEREANILFPAGCKCGNNGGGDCDWCQVYYSKEEYYTWINGELREEALTSAQLSDMIVDVVMHNDRSEFAWTPDHKSLEVL